MAMSPAEVNDLLDAIAKVLLRCVVIGILILLLTFAMVLVAGDAVHSIHSKWFDVTRHEFDVIVYCSLALGKTCVALFFLVPWLSIRLVLRKRK
jgi:hypothetical protein